MSVEIANLMPRTENEVTFTVNGVRYTVDEDVPIGTTLNSFLRDYCQLRGTKYMCYEGGCGSCVVSVQSKNAYTKEDKRYAVNSCLVFVHACQGWVIKTIEGIGNKKIGYHKLQLKLAQYNGTQCGYCSPGMVMNMYSISEGRNITMKEVENSFGGNICRCTGYRPILDAFKSVCIDAPPELSKNIQDIEDLYKVKMCKQMRKKCIGDCAHIHGDNEECLEDDFVHVNEEGREIVQHSLFSSLHLKLNGGTRWFKVAKLDDIFNIFQQIGSSTTYMLVAGNTAHGVYRVPEPPQVYIDVKDVGELLCSSVSRTLKLGANMSLTDTIAFLDATSKKNVSFSYTSVLAKHIKIIANLPVRNIGTLAGNLMTKYQHNEFPSDLFLIFETVGATLNIRSKQKTENLEFPEFLDLEMNHKIILNVELPAIDPSVNIKTYKIMVRAENAHAYVNAGFKFNLNKIRKGNVLKNPTIVFGGINKMFIHASKTEDYLEGKNLFDVKVLQSALETLKSELKPDFVLPDASPEYRKMLACALFYKFVLNLNPPGLSKFYASGGEDYVRPLSSGKQDFDTDQKEWPLTKPVPKLDGLVQCSGEAEYVNDIPAIPGEAFAAYVVTKVGKGYIDGIDASEALKIPGVLLFLTAENIPGKNSFITFSNNSNYFQEDEEIFCSSEVKYAGQPLGIIVAKTNRLALSATSKVKVKYSGVGKPLISMREVIDSKDKSRLKIFVPEPSEEQDASSVSAARVIKGSLDCPVQYHFTMETQQCVCIPKEDELDVFSSTQHIDFVQNAISQSLNIQANRINIQVRRLGGGYGAKVSRAAQLAAACALAACSLNRAVRFLLPLETNTETMGSRNRAIIDYEVGTDDNGKIQYLKSNIYGDGGINYNEQMIPLTADTFKNCYDTSNWTVRGICVRTDIASTVWMRAPGSTEAIAGIEHIMEHIAKTLKKDPIEIRFLNMGKDMNDIQKMIQELRKSSEFDERKKNIDDFNKNNRWVKKGISLIPMLYGMGYLYNYYAMVSIYGHDGSVAVAHGGTECGQGINTKVAQTVAYGLGISLDMVSVKPDNNLTAPNGQVTAGSVTSEVTCFSALQCCKELLKRMEPIKKTLKDPTWTNVVKESVLAGVDLNASHMYPYGDEKGKQYEVYGVCVTEIRLDVLTGQHQILKVDILEDAGRSPNPYIDIGQIEGAFVMGLGHWLQEYFVFDPKSGQVLTNRTWNYKPPISKDIPIDFQIKLKKDAPNPYGLTSAKATGEPAVCLSFSAVCALRHAIDSVRKDSKLPDKFADLKLPATPENTFLACELDIKQFVI